jgi:NlpC/P60 family
VCRACYPPPPLRGPGRGGGVGALIAITLLVFLAAPHAHHLRPQVAVLRGLLAGDLPNLPRVQLPRLPPAPPPAASGAGRAARAVVYALAQRGKPYRWGAEGPQAFDCSGLTWAAWRAAGVAIPRTAQAQLDGLPRARGGLRPGDLVIYASSGPSRRHVAMVVAPGLMVEALGAGIPVRSTRLRPGWFGAVRPAGGGGG